MINRRMSLRNRISSSKIRRAARTSKSISELAAKAGYSCPSSVGSYSMNRIKDDIGVACYNEIASGYRKNMSCKMWTKPLNV